MVQKVGPVTDDDEFAAGGVFTTNGTSITNGVVDTNDDTEITIGTTLTGTISAPDSFGRGTIANTQIATTLVYYVVGPEVIRMIDMDSTDYAVGTAFGQGASAGNFSNASIGKSVFNVSGASIFDLSVLVGQFFTGSEAAVVANAAHPNGTVATNTFQGIADVDDEGEVFNAVAISGNYFVLEDGRGNLSITNEPGFFNLSYELYAVDPNLNLNDPNNTSTGLGGSLMLDVTEFEDVSVGILMPQTDTATASFAGGYAFGMQFISDNDEADFVGQGTVTGTAIAGSGVVNDPFQDFFEDNPLNIDVPIAGTLVPDLNNPGRYTMHFLDLGVGGLAPVEFDATVYQASGGQLFWIGLTTETDSDTAFNGPIQQQTVVTVSDLKAASKKAHKP